MCVAPESMEDLIEVRKNIIRKKNRIEERNPKIFAATEDILEELIEFMRLAIEQMQRLDRNGIHHAMALDDIRNMRNGYELKLVRGNEI